MKTHHTLRFVLPLLGLCGALATMNGCAAEANADEETAEDEENLTSSSVGVTLDWEDDGASFAVQEGKKIVVNLSYGGFTRTPHGKWKVKSAGGLGTPTIKDKFNHEVPDVPVRETLTWKLPASIHAGETHKVVLVAESLDGGADKKFTFTAKITKVPTVAKEGQKCGASIRVTCEDGLDCKLLSDAPGASGICRKRFVGAGVGQMCGGIAGRRCSDGLTCTMSGPRHPDQSGICR